MKFIEERDGFLNEALRKESSKKIKEKKILSLLKDLYDIFKGDTGVYMDSKMLGLQKIIKKHSVANNVISGMGLFLIKHGKNNGMTYSLKSNKKPDIKMAKSILEYAAKNTKILRSKRKEIYKESKEVKGLSREKRIEWALKKIKNDIKVNLGNIVPTGIWMQAGLQEYYNKLCVKLGLYYNYKMKSDAATLKQVEKYFGKAWKPRLGFPEFSEVKHRLYVWNAGDVTDGLVEKVVEEYFINTRKDTATSMANETPEERNYRLARVKKRLASETPEERELRLAKLKEYTKKSMANETPEHREARLHKAKLNKRKSRASETPEKKELRLAKAKEYYKIKKK